MAPSTTQGAVSPSHLSAAMTVWVPQRPNGAAARRRSPRRLRPRSRVIFSVDRGLVDEHQACRLKPHPGLTLLDPLPAPLTHVGAFALRGHQLFFYM